MIFNEQTKAEFSAMLLKEYGIELSRRSELLPIIYLMHAYEEKMGHTIAGGFGFMDAAGTQLTESSLKLDALMAEIKTQLDNSNILSAGNSVEQIGTAAPVLTGKNSPLLLVIAALQVILVVLLLVVLFRG